MKKWVALCSMAAMGAACSGNGNATTAAAAEAGDVPAALVAEAPEAPAAPAIPVYREVTVPSGTTLRLDLVTAIGSDTSRVEDTVRAKLRQSVTVNGQPVLPAGTELVGVVTDVDDAGRVKGRARIAYRFSSLRYDGDRYDVSTATISHQAPATKGEDATKIAVGAGAGAAIGALLGGGSGAVKGAAIGGAGGTGVVLATKGKEVRLGPGANVNTRLTEPLTVRVKS